MPKLNKSIIQLAAILSVCCSTAATTAMAAGVIDFDNVPAGSSATDAAPAGISFLPAVFDSSYDLFGDPIAGTLHWQVDTSLDPDIVTVEIPLINGYGPAPSGENALDARFQPTFLHFDHVTDVSSFSATLDNSPFGDLAPASVLFLNSAGDILSSLQFDETIPGAIINGGPVNGVRDILLASGAFYDDIRVAPVPLPASLWLFMSAALTGLIRRRRNI